MGYSDTINEAAINFILREFVMAFYADLYGKTTSMTLRQIHPEARRMVSHNRKWVYVYHISTVARMQMKNILAVGIYKQAVTLYLQLLKSMCEHFVEDEHFCYFDDMYSPEYSLQWIYEGIMKYDIDQESRKLLEDGHKEILQSECY